MRSPAQAIIWQLTSRYRIGMLAVGAYLAVLCLYCSLAPAGSLSPVVGPVGAIPVALGLVFLLGAFTFGLEVNMSDRRSGYPARMFTLPVRTTALVGWPMLLATATVALGWVVLARFALHPCGVRAMLWLPAMTFASVAAWLQALAWAPFGLAQTRLVASSLVLTTLISIPVVGMSLYRQWEGVPEVEWLRTWTGPNKLLVLQAVLTAPAWLVAWRGVSQARRGANPDWQWLTRLAGSVAGLLPRRQGAFESAAAAQSWFEWRRNGLILPLLMATMAPFMAWMMLLVPQPPASPLHTLSYLLISPMLVSAMLGGHLGRVEFWSRRLPLTAFAATRPIPCSQYVAAKFKMTMMTTAASWAIVLMLAVLWFAREGRWELLKGACQLLTGPEPGWLVYVALPFFLLLAVLMTWQNLAGSLWIGLAGRVWVTHLVTIGSMGLFMSGVYFAWWFLGHPEKQAAAGRWMLWLAGVAVVVKLALAIWTGRALVARGLLSPAAVRGYRALWLAAAAYLVVMLCLLIPASVGARHWVALCVVLMVPFSRLACAPLALAWNRHR